jgi:hypothetical protein
MGAEAGVRRALFAVALIGGVMALFAELRAPRGSEAVTAEQLAQWIRDGKPGVRILDGRSKAAFDWYHIPGAQRATSGSIVVIADGRTLELRGGMQAWLEMLQRPGALSRYFGGPPRRGGC